jgi:type II secretory pathway pseudopilin PulG
MALEAVMNESKQETGSATARKPSRHSFTLIELLVVVSVILILLGISLKIMGLVNRKAGVARTTWIVEQVKNALGAYYTSYGTYPPGDKAANGYTSVDWVDPLARPPYNDVEDWFVSTGLVYYLKNMGEASRWAHYITFVPNNSDTKPVTNAVRVENRGPVPPYTNGVQSIVDAWGRKLRYVSSGTDGYQSYRLWSCGPNGADNNGGGDDLGVTTGE